MSGWDWALVAFVAIGPLLGAGLGLVVCVCRRRT